MDMIYLFANYKEIGEKMYAPVGVTINTMEKQKSFLNSSPYNDKLVCEVIDKINIEEGKDGVSIFPNIIPCNSNAYVVFNKEGKIELFSKKALPDFVKNNDFLNINYIQHEDWVIMPRKELENVLMELLEIDVESKTIKINSDKEIPEYLNTILQDLIKERRSMMEIVYCIMNLFTVRYMDHIEEERKKSQADLKEQETEKLQEQKENERVDKNDNTNNCK